MRTTVADRGVSVEGEDVLNWSSTPTSTPDATSVALDLAPAYIAANPRPDRDAQGAVNVPARQRVALLRRLAAGPATKAELLVSMREAAGYVGGDDWRNRYDELRGHGKRGGGHLPLHILHDEDDDTYRLVETFALLSDRQRDELAKAKAALTGTTAGNAAVSILDGLLPDVPSSPVADPGAARPPVEVVGAFDLAMQSRDVIAMRYRSSTGRTVVAQAVVPLRYVTRAASVRAWVVELDAGGGRHGGRTIAVDDILEVLPNPTVTPATAALEPALIGLRVRGTEAAAHALVGAEAYGVALSPDPAGGPTVLEGTLNVDLAAEAVRVLAAWAGEVSVLTPRWLAAGLAVLGLRSFVAQLALPRAIGAPQDVVDTVRATLTQLERQALVHGGEAAPPEDWLA